MTSKPKLTIGRASEADFPDLTSFGVPVRIDTGAKTSSIWASSITVAATGIEVVFFGEGSSWFTGEPVLFTSFEKTVVSSSTGELQERYKVRLLVIMNGRKIRAWFTLADRSSQVYPVLIGRNVLLGKFIVDVKEGSPLTEEERRRTQELRARIYKADREGI